MSKNNTIIVDLHHLVQAGMKNHKGIQHLLDGVEQVIHAIPGHRMGLTKVLVIDGKTNEVTKRVERALNHRGDWQVQVVGKKPVEMCRALAERCTGVRRVYVMGASEKMKILFDLRGISYTEMMPLAGRPRAKAGAGLCKGSVDAQAAVDVCHASPGGLHSATVRQCLANPGIRGRPGTA